jgi:hypothetical protein
MLSQELLTLPQGPVPPNVALLAAQTHAKRSVLGPPSGILAVFKLRRSRLNTPCNPFFFSNIELTLVWHHALLSQVCFAGSHGVPRAADAAARPHTSQRSFACRADARSSSVLKGRTLRPVQQKSMALCGHPPASLQCCRIISDPTSCVPAAKCVLQAHMLS